MERKKVDAKKWSEKGIVCPRCGSRLSKTRYVRNMQNHIFRKRACLHCGYVMKTQEKLTDDESFS